MSELISPIAKRIITSLRDTPFALQGECKTYESKAGLTIAEIIGEVTEEWQKPYLRVILNDEILLSDDYALTIPGEGDILNILVVPHGGDAGGIFKMVAMIAIVITATVLLSPGVGAPLSAQLLAGAAVGAISLVSSLALNALFPPPSPSSASGSSGVVSDPVYGFSTVQNAANPYGVIPRVYGRRMLMPQHAMNPYVVSSGSDQYLHQIFTAGYGPLAIEQIMIGNTPLSNYKDVEYYIHESFEAGDELKICKNDIWQDPYSIALLHNVEHIVQTTDDAQSAAIDIQFPQGVYQVNTSTGANLANFAQVSVQIRQSGTTTFYPITDFSPTIDGPGAYLEQTVTASSWAASGSAYADNPNHVVVDALPDSSSKPNQSYLTTVTYDEFGAAIYQDHQNTYTTTGSSNLISVNTNTNKPFFVTANVTFPSAGKWDIRLVRNVPDQTASNLLSKSYLSSIRSIKNIPPIAPDKPMAIIELKIKASDQLNGSVQNLSCIVTSKLPVWNGSSWTVQSTRNPAWAYLDVLRGNAIKIPVSDYRINLGAFLSWANWCDEPVASFAFTPSTSPDTATTAGYVTSLYYTNLNREPDSAGLAYWINQIDSSILTRAQVASAFINSAEGQDDQRAKCDVEITSQTTVWDALKLIAGTGYATPSSAGGKYSIAIDRVQSTPVQLFTPRNIESFSGLLSYHIQPHALRVQYTPTDSTTATEVVVFDDGYSADGAGGTQVATIYETMPLVGITRYNQAYVMGRRSIAQGRLRIETFTLKVDAENLLANRGDFVRLAHDVPKLGAGWGRVANISGNVLTLDESITNPGGSLVARVRKQDGAQVDLSVSLVSGSSLTVSSTSGINIGDVVAYGIAQQITIDCLVKSIKPDADFKAQLELIPYAPGIYTAETNPIPAYNPYGGEWTGGGIGGGNNNNNTTTPGIVSSLLGSYVITYTNTSPSISVTLSWGKPAQGGTAVSYKIYYLDYAPVVSGATNTEYVTNVYKTLLLRDPDSSGLAYYVGLLNTGSATRTDIYNAIHNSAEALSIGQLNGGWRLLGTTNNLNFIAFNDYQFLDSSGNPIDFNGKTLTFAVTGLGSDGSSIPPENAAHAVVTPIVTKPSATATLTVTGGFFANNLHWTYSTNQFDIAAVEIWGATVNNRASASLIAKVPTPTDSYSHTGLSPTVTWYYWIKAVNANGVYSDWYPLSATAGVSGRPSDDASYLLTQLYGKINTDQIAAELNTRINLIDGPDTTPGTVAANIKTEATTRAAADTSLASSISTVSAQSITNAAAIVTEQTARTNADTAISNSITTVQARLDTGDYAAVKTSASASASSITGLNAKYSLQVDAGGRVAGVQLNSSSSGSSSFTVLADNFNVYKPSVTGSPVQVFGLGTVNGTTALGLNGQLIVDGSIVARNISVGAVGTIKIDGNAVSIIQAASVFNYGSVYTSINITANDLPPGQSSVPIIVTGSRDIGPTSYYFDMAVNPSSLSDPGNLVAALPPTTAAGVQTFQAVHYASPGSYTFYLYDHYSPYSSLPEMRKQSISIQVGKR